MQPEGLYQPVFWRAASRGEHSRLTLASAVLRLAGTRIARYADIIAERTNVERAAIGALLLGDVSSLPERAVAITAT